MAEAEAEDNKPAVDPRVIWLRQRICSVLRCKEDRVERLLGNEESAAAVSAFLDGAELNRLLVYDSGKGELAAVRAPAAARRARLQGGGRLRACAWLTSAYSRYAPRRRRTRLARSVGVEPRARLTGRSAAGRHCVPLSHSPAP